MTEMHDALHQHLEAMATFMRALSNPGKPLPYAGMEDFVLREGRDMDLTPTDPQLEMGTAKECFANATHYMLQNQGCVYAEGYVISPKLPIAIHHAWVLNPEGLVLDPTLEWREGAAYMGVSFTRKDLLRRITKSGYYGLFCADGIRISDLVLGLDKKFTYKGKSA